MNLATILSLILPTIPALIRGIEGVLGKGSGAEKMSLIETTALQLINGTKPGVAISPELTLQLKAILETLVAQNVGTKANPAPPIPPSNFSGSLNFKDGSLVSFG